MTKKRRQYNAQFKFQVALEATQGHQTISQIASRHQVHPTMVSGWKKQLLQDGPAVFEHQASRQAQEQASRETELYEQIGRLKMELEWLKKKAAAFRGGETNHD